MVKTSFFKPNSFFVRGLFLAPIIFIILFSNISCSLTAQDYWDFYEKYITDFKFLDPYVEENTSVYGDSGSGYTFYVHSIFEKAYTEGNLTYWYLQPSGVLFYAEHLPIVSFKFRFNKYYYANTTYPRPLFPILCLTHLHNYNDMLLLLATVSPAETTAGNDQINFFWWRIYFDPTTMTTRVEKLNVTDGAYTYIFLNGRTVFTSDIQISIIPAIYSEKVNDTATNTTYYNALFGFYTIVNIESQNISSGFSVAWKSLKFTKDNLTEFRTWLDRFFGWYIWLGTGYFAKTNKIAIKFVQPNNFITSSDYVDIVYKSVGVFDAKVDEIKYYNDLVSGLLPEYQQTEIIDLTNQQTYSFDPNKLTPIFLYIAATVIPGSVLRRRQYVFAAAAIVIVLNAAMFYILFNDLAFLVFSGLLLIFLFKFHSGGWY